MNTQKVPGSWKEVLQIYIVSIFKAWIEEIKTEIRKRNTYQKLKCLSSFSDEILLFDVLDSTYLVRPEIEGQLALQISLGILRQKIGDELDKTVLFLP